MLGFDFFYRRILEITPKLSGLGDICYPSVPFLGGADKERRQNRNASVSGMRIISSSEGFSNVDGTQGLVRMNGV